MHVGIVFDYVVICLDRVLGEVLADTSPLLTLTVSIGLFWLLTHLDVYDPALCRRHGWIADVALCSVVRAASAVVSRFRAGPRVGCTTMTPV